MSPTHSFFRTPQPATASSEGTNSIDLVWYMRQIRLGGSRAASSVTSQSPPDSRRLATLLLQLQLMQRDITPEDYSLLQQLDELEPHVSAYAHATEGEIHRLPTDVMSEKWALQLASQGGEASVCSICLDLYAEGDSLRTLPCLHRFHCGCIDPWLAGLSTTCPICKSSVLFAV
jgi:hypothetical protein